MAQRSIRFPDELEARGEAMAAWEGRTFSWLVVRALEAMLAAAPGNGSSGAAASEQGPVPPPRWAARRSDTLALAEDIARRAAQHLAEDWKAEFDELLAAKTQHDGDHGFAPTFLPGFLNRDKTSKQRAGVHKTAEQQREAGWRFKGHAEESFWRWVGEMAADEAHLFLWTTRRLFREGIAAEVARAWGFEPCGEIIWGLRNPGMGGITGNGHEPVLIASRGGLPFPKNALPCGVQFWKQPYAHGKIHSAKPEGFLAWVEGVSPGPYVELFARRARFGWDYWGDESLGTAVIPGQAS